MLYAHNFVNGCTFHTKNQDSRMFFAIINLFHNFHFITGPAHKDSLYSSMHLASLLKMQDKPQEALAMLEEALIVAEEKYTKM